MSIGFKTRIGLAREQSVYAPTWPSAAPALVTALLPVKTESLSETAQLAVVTTRGTRGSQTHATVVASEADAPFTADLPYEGMELVFALALGFQAKRLGGVVFPEEIVPGASRHRFEIDRRLQGAPWQLGDGFLLGTELLLGQHKVRRATVAAHRGGISVWESLSSMVASLSLSGAPGQPLQLTVDMLAHSVSNASAVNTPETLAALGVPAAPRVLWHHGALTLAPYSTEVALSAGDAVACTGAELRIDNGLGRVNGRRTGLYTDEPDRQGPCQVSGSLTLPRYVSDTLVFGQRAGQAYMMTWTFTGREIGATGIPYQWTAWFPDVRFSATTVASAGAGRIPVSVQFTALEPVAWPAGFPLTLHQGALVVEVTSGRSTNPLL